MAEPRGERQPGAGARGRALAKGVRSQAETATGPAGATPFIDGYLAYLLARASHVVSSQFHSLVRAEGLSVLEWRVLATLYDADALTVGRLADAVLAQQPTLTKLLARVEAEGLVCRSADTRDRRRTLVHITAAGRARVARLIGDARRHEASMLAPFGSERVEALKTVLRGVIERSGQCRAPRARD